MHKRMKPAWRPSRLRQRGIAALMAVLLLVTAVIFALVQTLGISGAAGTDNLQQLRSTAAFFLAESGIENAQSILRSAALAGTISNTSCTGLSALSPVSLGSGNLQGTFRYSAAVSTPTTCGGANPACTSCALTVRGDVVGASRSILTQMSANRSDGVEGYGHQFTLNLDTSVDNSFAFTHLAYNPQTNWGGDAVAGYCQNNGPGSLTTCTESWKLAGTFYNNTASQGVFASVASAGVYTITEELKTFDTPPVFTDRNYVQTGVTFRPLTGFSTVTHVGSFASSPNNICVASATPRTQPITYYVGSATYCARYEYQYALLDANWTCNPSSGTSVNWPNAANADTLIVGFGGKPYYGGSGARRTNQLNGLSLNGQALYRQLTMSGTQGDSMYSQIWYAYNPGYYSSTANATNANTFTGAVGAQFTGSIGPTSTTFTGSISGTTLTVTSTTGTLLVGDTLSSNAPGTDVRNNTKITQFGTGTGGTGTYTVSGASQTVSSRTITATRSTLTVTNISTGSNGGALRRGDTLASNASGTDVSTGTTITQFGTGTGGLGTYFVSIVQTVGSRTITAASNILRVSAITGSSLAAGDQISSGITSCTAPACPTIQPFTTSGTTGSGATGDYVLNAQFPPVNNGAATAMSTSGSTTITLSGATTLPAVGTALGVVAGTGEFLPDRVTAAISGSTMTVSAATGTHLSVGDALFGAGLLPNTRITALLTGSGGTGTYSVTPSQTVASSAIMARAAVLTVSSANSFTVSRLPSTGLSAARLCGGLCPFLLSDGVHTVGQVDLSNILDYDDWTAGFACLRGVDPSSIENLGTILSKRSGWSEVVQ